LFRRAGRKPDFYNPKTLFGDARVGKQYNKHLKQARRKRYVQRVKARSRVAARKQH